MSSLMVFFGWLRSKKRFKVINRSVQWLLSVNEWLQVVYPCLNTKSFEKLCRLVDCQTWGNWTLGATNKKNFQLGWCFWGGSFQDSKLLFLVVSVAIVGLVVHHQLAIDKVEAIRSVMIKSSLLIVIIPCYGVKTNPE